MPSTWRHGQPRHTLELCRELSRRGHDVALAVRHGYALEERASGAGLNVIPLRMPGRFRPLAELGDARILVRYCRAHRVEILHPHRGKDHWLAVIARILGRLDAALVRTRHVVTNARNHLPNRWLARRTAALVCVSGEVARNMALSDLYPADKVHVVPAGVDLSRFRPSTNGELVRRSLGIDPAAPVAVMVARFNVIKGHEYVIEAAEELARELPSAAILLVGEGSHREHMEGLVRLKGLGGTVRFLGWRDDVADILDASDVGLLSSVGSEGSSRAVMEYMASGLPVIGTRTGAIPELILDGETGVLVDTRDPGALAGAMLRVLGDREAARRMGERGRSVMVAGFSIGGWVDRMEEFYRRFAAPGGGGATG